MALNRQNSVDLGRITYLCCEAVSNEESVFDLDGTNHILWKLLIHIHGMVHHLLWHLLLLLLLC